METYIPRHYQDLGGFLKPNKVVVIFGPRQAGKTTLIRKYLETTSFKYRLETGDDLRMTTLFESNNFEHIREFAAGYELIVIDEAQKIKDIGQGLKILTDYVKGVRVLVTGSSSFELAGQIGEPLTGRKISLHLFPFSQSELGKIYNPYDLKSKLHEFLIYGSYPEVVITQDKNEKIRILNELVGSYLLKDILELDRVKSSKLLLDLLRQLAFQVGNLVSLTELSNSLQIDYKTVARYLDLFEKSYVIYSLRGFSKNLRSELTRKCKYYFYDNGIRNTLISNFNPIDLRNDHGMLWENFIFMERLKWRTYNDLFANTWFWRTYENKEIDLIEEREGKLYGYEFKWGNKIQKAPGAWISNYPDASYQIINPENYPEFIK